MRTHPQPLDAGTTVGNPARPPTGLTLSNGLTPAPTPWEPRRGLVGRHDGLSYADYAKDPALRHSLFRHLYTSPLHFRTALEKPDEDNAALTWGRVFHTLVLQPELAEASVVVVEASDRRTNIYKAEAARNPGKDLVLAAEWDDIRRARDRFNQNRLNTGILGGTAKEVSLFWEDGTTGLPCKARLDALDDSWIVDIKTTRDIGRMRWDAKDYGYFTQAGWYATGAKSVLGGIRGFVLIAVEKTAPFDSRVFRIPYPDVVGAEERNVELLEQLRKCLAADHWPGYAYQIEELKP